MPLRCEMMWLLALLGLCGGNSTLDAAPPKLNVHDDRLQIDLVCEHPQIVTPTGIAVDEAGDVFVVESHTHFPPNNYSGPKFDRLLRLRNVGRTDRPLEVATWYEGTRHTMNVAFHPPTGSLYVATRMEVFRLRDVDGDGRAEERMPIAHLDTKGDYPHNGLSGFAFDFEGHVYFGFGENLGAEYKLIGSDGTTLPGGGEGGNVYCCRADGTGLRRIATGFWNPFHLCLDIYGNLFAVDNDPDSRPPCRLLHVVDGGDYGFRFRLGRKGTHPFIAWNGELAGALPMVAGTGEAPSGVLAYESDGLPEEYRGDLLGTSWGDHRIERYHLERRGASFLSTMKPVVSGGEDFRPVGIACAPDGSLLISDWVDKSYNVHGKGRIWRLRSKAMPPARPRQLPADAAGELKSPDRAWRERAARQLAATAIGRAKLRKVAEEGESVRVRAAAIAALGMLPGELPVKQLLATEKDENLRAFIAAQPRGNDAPFRTINPQWLQAPALAAALLRSPDYDIDDALRIAALASPDPFLRQAAREGLLRAFRARRDVPAEEIAGLWAAAPAEERLLLLRATGRREAQQALPGFLQHDSPAVRALAAQWIGEDRLVQFAPLLDLRKVVHVPSQKLLEAVITADTLLSDPKSQRSGDELLTRVAVDPRQPPAIRLLALRGVRPDFPGMPTPTLFEIATGGDEPLQREAVRSLRERDGSGQAAKMIALARDDRLPVSVRAEAILGVPADNHDNRGALFQWALGGDSALAREAVRGLRGALGAGDQETLAKLKSRFPGDTAWQALVALTSAAAEQINPTPQDLAAWVERAKAGTPDLAAGERLFFSPRVASCYRCHQMDGRGGKVGPELTLTGPALALERLVESIVQPSREVAPQFTAWQVTLVDGRQFLALLEREEVDGTQVYLTPDGKELRVKPGEIDERRLSPKSLMPDGLAATLTPEEFRDLVAYVNRKPAGDGK